MKYLPTILTLILLGLFFSILSNCKKEKTVLLIPTITTSSVSKLTSTSATSGGEITSDGGAIVTARGVCWSTNQNPTTSDSKTNEGSGSGIFTSNLTGLIAGKNYYLRAYATNIVGTAYGNQLSMTTNIAYLPVITTKSISSITTTSAICGGSITSDGGAAVSIRGVCWSTNQNPTISDNVSVDGNGIGDFTSTISGLVYGGGTVYVRAYATNSVGTVYGGQESFITILLMTTYKGTGNSPMGIAFDGANMWTANSEESSVTKITPSGTMTTYGDLGVISNTISRPYGIAFDGTKMWTANFGSNCVSPIGPLGASGSWVGLTLRPIAIAFDGTNMWTANSGDQSVTKITPSGVMTNYAGIPSPMCIAFDGTNMWTASTGSPIGTWDVSKITPTGAITNYTNTGFTGYDIAFDGTNMWVVNQGGNVTKVSPSGGMTTYAGGISNPLGIAFDGTNMWTTNTSNNSVTKITPSGVMTNYTGTGSYPYKIAFDGTNMWTTNFNDNSVTKIKVR